MQFYVILRNLVQTMYCLNKEINTHILHQSNQIIKNLERFDDNNN